MSTKISINWVSIIKYVKKFWDILAPILHLIKMAVITPENVQYVKDAVRAAKDLKHDDGTAYTGEEKYQWVVARIKSRFNSEWLMNLLIEMAVGMMKAEENKL